MPFSFDGTKAQSAFGGIANYLLTDTPGFSCAGFIQPTTIDGAFHTVLARGNVGATVRPLFIGVNGSATFGTLNSLIFLPNVSGSWAISTTSALTVNHFYFFLLTHLGTGTTSTNLYVYDLTTPAGLMATSTHGTMGGVDTDTSSNVLNTGQNPDGTLRFKGVFAGLGLWTGQITSAEALAMAYAQRPIRSFHPSQLIWWLNGEVESFATPISSGSWGGGFNASSSGNPLYTATQPPIYGYPNVKQNLMGLVLRAAASSSVDFRKTLSGIGGRIGSRQIQGYMNG